MSTAIKRIMKEGICSKVYQYAKGLGDVYKRQEQTGRFKGAAVHRWQLVAHVVLIQHVDPFNKECQPSVVPGECPVHANVESRVSRDAERIAFRMLIVHAVLLRVVPDRGEVAACAKPRTEANAIAVAIVAVHVDRVALIVIAPERFAVGSIVIC